MVSTNGRSTAIADKTAIPAAPHSFNGHAYSPTLATGNQYLPPDTEFRVSFELPLREARDAFERAYFEHHLKREGGSMTRVAERTGLERTHLYRKLKQLGVESNKAAKKTG